MDKILTLKNLKKHYPIHGGVLRREIGAVRALDGIDLDIYRGECLGVVGESGCGKTTAGKAIVRLFRPTDGHIFYYPTDAASKAAADLARLKRSRIKKLGLRSRLQMVFQDPTTSLDPRMLVKHVVAEPIKT
ncbi:MAG: ATP-binding cassette domain-containing protein, partial [Desulfobacterales bacterium]